MHRTSFKKTMSLSCLLQVSHVLAMIMLQHTNNIPGRIEWRAQEAGKEKGPGRRAGRGLVVVGRESGTRVVLLLRAQSRPLPLFSSPLPCQMPKEI